MQQLGRGLRIDEQKEFVTVIDFVGNYKSNYNIPVALYGDRSLEREKLRRLVADGGNTIVGPTVIQFDEISRERVLRSVNKANLNSVASLGRAYRNLRMRMGHIPTLANFAQLAEVSPRLVFENSNFGCYHSLLERYEKDYTIRLAPEQVIYLRFVSEKLADGKRAAELLVLRELMRGDATLPECVEILRAFDRVCGQDVCDVETYEREARSSVRILSLEFFNASTRSKLKPACEPLYGDFIGRSPGFVAALEGREFVRQLNDVIEYGLGLYKSEYSVGHDQDQRLCRGKRYSRADACRLLCWDNDEHGAINGYSFKTNDWPIFVTYRKSDEVSDSVKYEDEFESRSRFIWFSQSNRSLKSKDYQKLSSFDESAQRIHLFVKKDDSEGQDHYYLGTLSFSVDDITEEQKPDSSGKVAPILRIPFTLDHAVDKDTYRYLTS